MKKRILVFFILMLVVLGFSVGVRANWNAEVEEDPFSGEKEIIIFKSSEDYQHTIAIRNIFGYLELIIFKHNEELEFDVPTRSRYKFDDNETKEAYWEGDKNMYYYDPLFNLTIIKEDNENNESSLSLKNFVRNMMDHDELTAEVAYKNRKNEYVVFDLSGFKEKITPYLDEFGL